MMTTIHIKKIVILKKYLQISYRAIYFECKKQRCWNGVEEIEGKKVEIYAYRQNRYLKEMAKA